MIRYKKLGYVALDVTDLEKSTQFYENTVGLKFESKLEDGTVFFRCSRDHHNLVLYRAEQPGLRRIGLEMETPEQLENLFEHFTKLGLNPTEVDSEELRDLRQGRTFRIKDPYAGVTFEFYSEIVQVAFEYEPTVTKIARLGHVVINTDKYDEMVKFMFEVMNFKASDMVDDGVVFMRCFPNPYHHSFGVGKGKTNSLHHVNFMVTDVDDVGKARNRLIYNDTTIVWGPGRHDPSGSIFLYFLDPDGMTVEYSFGMEEFPEEKPRKARLLDKDLNIIDIWGGKPDPRMGAVGDIK